MNINLEENLIYPIFITFIFGFIENDSNFF